MDKYESKLEWVVEELVKSRASVALAGVASSVLVSKLGLEPAVAQTIVAAIGTIVVAYVAGKSHTDAHEAKAEAAKGEVVP